MLTLIDRHLLDDVCQEAAASQRRRKNRNFHPHDDYPGHRLLNAMQPDSYIAAHRHLDAHKDETMVVLRGCLGLVVFDERGTVLEMQKLGAGEAALGVDIPHGTWHTVVALAPDTVFLEAKSGPYLPLEESERAAWCPAERDPAAPAQLASWQALFAKVAP